GPADRHRRQIARLAGRLLANGAIRLERLQGFGAPPGGLATCGCSRFGFPNGSHGVLIAAGNIALIAPRPAQMESDNEMQPAAADEPAAAQTIPRAPPPAIEAFADRARRLPLRFTWQMDREGRFTLGTDEFAGLMGPRTTAASGRPWREIAETFGLDPSGRMMQAFAT